MNLFGKSKQPILNINQVINNLRESLSILDKREKHLEKQMNTFKNNVKESIKQKDKQKALIWLKRKSILEKQYNNIIGMKMNIDHQILTLEGIEASKQTYEALKQSKNVISQIKTEIKPDDVDELMEDLSENMNDLDEVSNMLSTNIIPIDEDELNNELKEYENETIVLQIDEKVLPNVPTKVPKEKSLSKSEQEEQEEKELRDLLM